MFYAQFVLSKKGPLAKIWLAAHWEKKLSKAQIYETNVQDAVDEILKPKVKMALRTTGHLLLGIVRIYSRKTKYLLADCNEAFLKIKMAFRPGQIDAIEEGQEVPVSTITLPEVYTDFDAALPDFNDIDIQHHLQLNQSRIDDITLKEDFVSDQNNYAADFGMDDFGESALGGGITFNLDEDFSLAAPGEEINMEQPNQDADAAVRDVRDLIREPTPSLEGARAPGADIFNEANNLAPSEIEQARHAAELSARDIAVDHTMLDDGDFGAGCGMDDDMLEAPGAEIADDLQLGAAANDMQGTGEQSFALDPLDMGAFVDRVPRQRKKRRLIVDDAKNISGDEMKANMADFTDTLQALDLAPPTKKLMKMRDCGNVEKLFHLPGSEMARSKTLIRLYQINLVPNVRDEEEVSHDDVRKELELAEQIEEQDLGLLPQESLVDDFDFADMSALDEPPSPIPHEEPFMDNVGMTIDQEPLPEHDPLSSPTDKKKEQRRGNRSTTEFATDDDTALEGDDDHRFTKRTMNVLNSIASKLRGSADGEILLSDLLTKASNRKTAAQKFYTLLVLKKWQAIDVSQTGPYEDIVISAGPKIDETMAH